MSILAKIISTFFGVGYFPLAPGTMGSLAALIVYWISPEITAIQLALIILGISVLGVYTATITEHEMKNKLGQEKGIDPGIIVIDEVVGMLIALLFVPKTTFFLIAAFILFRIFDITKPYPVRNMERFPGGWGIVLDDVIAGIYA
ncbi:phosphatidylglycerophosphatase A, partial [candidate division KSB1 bacterium]|nr:phosphatidylglycerophosphatase A [candidate division KSB1 bacterium]